MSCYTLVFWVLRRKSCRWLWRDSEEGAGDTETAILCAVRTLAMMLLTNALRGLLHSVLYHLDQRLKISVYIICMTFLERNGSQAVKTVWRTKPKLELRTRR